MFNIHMFYDFRKEEIIDQILSFIKVFSFLWRCSHCLSFDQSRFPAELIKTACVSQPTCSLFVTLAAKHISRCFSVSSSVSWVDMFCHLISNQETIPHVLCHLLHPSCVSQPTCSHSWAAVKSGFESLFIKCNLHKVTVQLNCLFHWPLMCQVIKFAQQFLVGPLCHLLSSKTDTGQTRLYRCS